MELTYVNEFARYRIECPPGAQVKRGDEGNDYLIVPDPDDPKQPYWLWDEVLLAAARGGDFGLRLLAVDPLN